MINLEEKLISEKQDYIESMDKIAKHFEGVLAEAEVEDIAVLESAGFDISLYKKILKTRDRNVSLFEPSRIFHEDEIKILCLKYDLRFLPVKYYKGTLDSALPQKLKELGVSRRYTHSDDFRIVAPKSSFKLVERPKDPLLFYELGDGMFYLVHKWGADLSIFNRVKGFLKTYRFILPIVLVLSLIGFNVFLGNNVHWSSYKPLPPDVLDVPKWLFALSIIASVPFGALGSMNWLFETDSYEKDYNSEYKMRS